MVGNLDSEMILESKNLTAFQLGFRIHSFSASSARYVAVGMLWIFFFSLSLSPLFSLTKDSFLPTDLFG